MKVSLSLWFFLNKFNHFLFFEEIMSSIYRLITYSD